MPDSMSSETVQWSVRDTQYGDVLSSVGDRAANEQRRDVLNESRPGRYELVSRVVTFTPWKADHVAS